MRALILQGNGYNGFNMILVPEFRLTEVVTKLEENNFLKSPSKDVWMSIGGDFQIVMVDVKSDNSDDENAFSRIDVDTGFSEKGKQFLKECGLGSGVGGSSLIYAK